MAWLPFQKECLPGGGEFVKHANISKGVEAETLNDATKT